MKIVNINPLIKRAYDNAEDKGFNEASDSYLEMINLIKGEIGECQEHYRKGDRAKIDDFRQLIEYYPDSFNVFFEGYNRNTFEEEIVDIGIRLFHFLGAAKISLGEIKLNVAMVTPKNEREYLNYQIDHIYTCLGGFINRPYQTNNTYKNNLTHSDLIKRNAKDIITILIKLSKVFDFDFFEMVEWKMKYNENREFLHGKQF